MMTTCIQCGGAFEGSGLACPACRGEVPRREPEKPVEARHPEFYRLASRFGPRIFRTVEVHGRDRRFDLPAREVAA